ncbi:MAG: sigma-54 dependent transcriptional regulator [Melioribacteraceae bacterium]|nr:sigma-54 dependent transcriptional regulator [Melioribacteraceae bacterium]MCF8353748.1 sigma-54 dependent transcriptional regulator [Melioribacteraceae bacterium]MCF8392443.1 sigma-54 dependent transcriptional regulator [Melioribacteraceae bacterium]MCF8418354.1 sigma-54 dependent transcriptional regulator [Melioribacteraceae bacterium]
MRPKILIIDDDNLVCASLRKVLIKMGYDAEICMEAEYAFESVEKHKPDIILLDIYLTTHNGLDILKVLHDKYFEIPVIMITAYSDVKIAVAAMKSGAYDFLLKPIDLEQLKHILDKCVNHLSLKREVDKLHAILDEDKLLTKEYFGSSRGIIKTLSIAERYAKAEDTTVLIEGESGTGKEVFANYIHQNSSRKEKVFISLNCGTIPKELAESELFGHEKGAFTGAAQKTKLGKFELSDGGTLLLDEIGELTLDLQVKLLRVLQERKFYRLGGERELSVNVRVIAATNKNLEDEVRDGNFREDLFYRLNVAKIIIPPLRERKEDIPALTYSFAHAFAKKFDKKILKINEDLIQFLQEQTWKGNIRELRNAVERAVLLLDGSELKIQHFDFLRLNKTEVGDTDNFQLHVPPQGVKIETVLRELIIKTLKITDGNQVRAAKILGLSRSKFRYRMEQLGIEITKNFIS